MSRDPPADTPATAAPPLRGESSSLAATCERLLADVRADRPGAWERMLDQFGEMVLAVPLEMRLDRPDAEDVFQATWLALHRSVPRIREPGALAAWILTTARREALAVLRGRSRRPADERDGHEPLADPADDPARLLETLERRRQVHEGLATLGARCRELLTRLYFAPTGSSYADIAAALDMKVGSVGPTRIRCLARLAEWLETREERT
jgi:RNA polymerase sigma factor (sigma-70 family)